MSLIQNFGRNVIFEPKSYYEPRDEAEVLALLAKHAGETIRVVGSKHGWSDGIVSKDVVLSLCHFDEMKLIQDGDQTEVVVGGGCQIKHLLEFLNKNGLTLPSVGLISEQTIAGATANATHGSGRHSLSHYITAARIACFDEEANPMVKEFSEGEALRAARCSLGMLGVVCELRLPCVPQYHVAEQARLCTTVEEALESEPDRPLQQFFFFPHAWRFAVQERVETSEGRSRSAPLYRVYWFLGIDITLHCILKVIAVWAKSRWMTRLFYRRLLPCFLFPRWRVVERSDKALIMEHELFRHLELEAFVPREYLVQAIELLELILKQAIGEDDQGLADARSQLEAIGLAGDFDAIRGTYSHHYPICVRRILRDDAMLATSTGESDWWYSISLITYEKSREDFQRCVTLVARAYHRLFQGRVHWGKWFPFNSEEIAEAYPEVGKFCRLQREVDPNQCFVNQQTCLVVEAGALQDSNVQQETN